MGRAARQAIRVPEGDRQADVGVERWQGRNHLPRELVHSAARTAKCAADPVSGFCTRRAISVPQSVRPGRVHLPRWVVRDGQSGLIIGGKTMLKLYGTSKSRSARSLWAMEELSLKYEHIPT